MRESVSHPPRLRDIRRQGDFLSIRDARAKAERLLVARCAALAVALLAACQMRAQQARANPSATPKIQRGLAPVSIGLLLAGSLTMSKGAVTGWITAAIAVAVLAILLRSRINPALLILAGSARGPACAAVVIVAFIIVASAIVDLGIAGVDRGHANFQRLQ